MVFIRSSSFVVGIAFLLLHFVASEKTDQVVAGSGFAVVAGGSPMSQQQKENLDSVPTGADDEAINVKFGGRKMMKRKLETAVKDANDKNVERLVSKKPSGAKLSRKGIKRKMMNTSTDDHDVKVKMSSTFMALNADYHVPKSHPPRNN